MSARRLAEVESLKERNALARDAFSYLHLPMVAAIVLVALGMKTTLAHVGDPLSWPTATALAGGAALYLLAHVAFKLRSMGSFSAQRFIAALVLLAVIPLAHEVDALVTVAVVGFVLWCLITFESLHYAETRDLVRHADVS